jgi:hypothetical protein
MWSSRSGVPRSGADPALKVLLVWVWPLPNQASFPWHAYRLRTEALRIALDRIGGALALAEAEEPVISVRLPGKYPLVAVAFGTHCKMVSYERPCRSSECVTHVGAEGAPTRAVRATYRSGCGTRHPGTALSRLLAATAQRSEIGSPYCPQRHSPLSRRNPKSLAIAIACMNRSWMHCFSLALRAPR